MELAYWWILIIWVVIVIVVCLAAFLVRVKRAKKVTPIAHHWRLTGLRSYQKIARRYRMYATLLLSATVVTLVSAMIISARPMKVAIERPEIYNRDIVLCLDISASMTSVDANVVKTFQHLNDGFKGERLGLTVFNSSSDSVFPLTSDYTFISDNLDRIVNVDTSEFYGVFNEFVYETTLAPGASIIGDGLASCVLQFDNLESKRSRSIVFVTDNLLDGIETISLPQAGALAKEKNIRVYGINPLQLQNPYEDVESTKKAMKQFEDAMQFTGGGYYEIDYERQSDQGVVQKIIADISSKEMAKLQGAPQILKTDTPDIFIFVTLGGLMVYLIVAWRARL